MVDYRLSFRALIGTGALLCAAIVAPASGEGFERGDFDCGMPEEEGLERIAWRIINGDCRLLLRGDSISVDGGSNSLAGGIRRTWRPWRWVGDLTQAHSSVGLNGTLAYFGAYSPNTRYPGEYFTGGQRGINARPAKDYYFGLGGVLPTAQSEVTRAELLSDFWKNHPDPEARTWVEERMECRVLYWQDGVMAPHLHVRALRLPLTGSAPFGAEGEPGVRTTPASICRAQAANPGVTVSGPYSTTLNDMNSFREWAFMGARFRRVDDANEPVPGFSFAVCATGGH